MSHYKGSQPVGKLVYNAGSRESNTITMPIVGSATQGDYVMVYNAAGTSLAAFIDIDSDGTAPTGALYTGSDNQAILAYKNAVQETYDVAFDTGGNSVQSDYFMIYDEANNSTAVWLDIDAAGTVPTGALYTGSDAQVEVDIASGDTAAQVGTKVYTAVNGNVTNVSFADDTAGTLTITLDNAGPAIDAVSKDADDSGAGSMTVGTITKGVLATTAAAGGALLAATSLTDVTFTDNEDGTVLVSIDDIGNATDCVPKNEDDSGAGSIGVSTTDGSARSGFPNIPTPAGSPADLSNEPSLVS